MNSTRYVQYATFVTPILRSSTEIGTKINLKQILGSYVILGNIKRPDYMFTTDSEY